MSPSENPVVIAPGTALARLGRLSVRALSPAALYDDWLVAEAEASLALTGWRDAARRDKPATFARYVAALDAEEAAAVRLHQRLGNAR